jgi:hypothetical protein
MGIVRTSEAEPRTEGHGSERRIAGLLAALATVEASFELDRQSLLEWSGPEALKRRFLTQLEMRHAQDRDWLVQRLGELYQSTTTPS